MYQQYYSKIYNKVVAQLKEAYTTMSKIMTPAMKCHEALVSSFKSCYMPGPRGNAELRQSDVNTIEETNLRRLNTNEK